MMFIVIYMNSRGQWVEWSSGKTRPSVNEVREYSEGEAFKLVMSISLTSGSIAQYTTLDYLYSLNVE